MNARTLPFGYYPSQLSVSVGPISISTLPNLADTVAAIDGDDYVENDWIYAPPQEVNRLGRGICTRPYPVRIFGLPKTHMFSHTSSDSDDHLVFHLWALSFFTGMRLTSTEAGFIDSTPIKPNKLFDFVLLGQGIADVLILAEAFWVKHRGEPERSKFIAGIVHALLLSQNPRHLQFEEFLLLYSAFDACFALAKSIYKPKKNSVTHANRVSWMCTLFCIPIPTWADDSITPRPEISSLRNESVHEALFMGQPLGFAMHGVGTNANLTLEMGALICRLLVALLGGEQAEYVRSPVGTYQRQGLKLAENGTP